MVIEIPPLPNLFKEGMWSVVSIFRIYLFIKIKLGNKKYENFKLVI